MQSFYWFYRQLYINNAGLTKKVNGNGVHYFQDWWWKIRYTEKFEYFQMIWLNVYWFLAVYLFNWTIWKIFLLYCNLLMLMNEASITATASIFKKNWILFFRKFMVFFIRHWIFAIKGGFDQKLQASTMRMNQELGMNFFLKVFFYPANKRWLQCFIVFPRRMF